MPTPATPLFTIHAFKQETTYGVVPSSGGAQVLRRVTAELDLEKDSFTSNEQRTDFQRADFRHGVRRAMGKIAGELSCGSYMALLAAAVKRAWTTVPDLTNLTLTIASVGNSTYTLTRSAGDWTSAVKSGHIFYLIAGTANNLNKRMLVVDVTPLVLRAVVLNGAALTTENAVAGYSFKTPGKVTYIPQTGHTSDSFSFEKWYSDLGQSEVFSGLRPTKTTVKLPPTGLATIDIEMVGQNMVPAQAQYFANPTAALGTGIMASVNGAARVNSVVVSNVTGAEFTINSPWAADPVAGSNVLPETVPDTVTVSGQVTMNFDSISMRDNFLNESVFELILACSENNNDNSNVLSFVMPRCKATSFKKSDEGGKSVSATVAFEALLQVGGGAGTKHEITTIWMHDTSLT